MALALAVTLDRPRLAARLAVTGIPAAADTLTVDRTAPTLVASGVRGAVDEDVSGETTFITRDYELPFNTDVQYRARAYDGPTVIATATATFRVDFDDCRVWLVDIARPTNSMLVTIEALPALQFEMPSGVHRVLDREDPVLTTLPAWSPVGEATILTETLDHRNRLREILGSGYPMLARSIAEQGIGDTYGLSYFGITGFTEERIMALGTAPQRRFRAAIVRVAPPDPSTFAPRAAGGLLQRRDRLRRLPGRPRDRPHLRRARVHVPAVIAVTDRFLTALRETHTVSVAASVYRPSAPTVPIEVPVVDGSLTMDADARTLRQASLEVAFCLVDPLTPEVVAELAYGGQAVLERGIRFADEDVERVKLGRFRVESVVWEAATGRASLTLADRMAQVADEPLLTPWAPTGKPSDAAVAAVTEVFGASIAYHVLTSPASEPTLTGGTIYDQDRAQAISDLASSVGAECLFDNLGDFVIRPRAVGSPVWTLDAGQRGVLVAASEALDRSSVRNGVAVRGSGGAGDPADLRARRPRRPDLAGHAGAARSGRSP